MNGLPPHLKLLAFSLLLSGSPVRGAVSSADNVVSSFSQSDVLMLIAFVTLALVFSFLCSIAEAVLLSITPSYIENLRSSRPKQANLVKKLRQDNIDRSLAAILTVNTIAHTVGAIAAGAKASIIFGSTWIGLFSGAMTLAILFLSEIIPKTIGAIHWPKLVGSTVIFIRLATSLLFPLIWVSERLTRLIAKGKSVHLFSRDELLAMTDIGERTGEMEEHETRIIRNLMHFRSLKARDIMTPRTVITALQQDTTVTEALQTILEHSFSRIPLYGKDIDDVTGVALRDEILAFEAQNRGEMPLSKLQRKIEYVSQSMTLPALLEQFLASRLHVVVVKNKHGGTKGLVSLEDVIEALLGMEIMDEMDSVEDMRKLARKQWQIRAKKLGIDANSLEQIAEEAEENGVPREKGRQSV